MKREAFLALFVGFALGVAAVVGCGGGGGEEGFGSVSGTVYAPDGVTPVADAYVYVPVGGVRDAGRQPAEAIVWTTSGPDGSFLLEDVPVGIVTIIISKGAWEKQFETDVNANQTTAATVAETTLPETGPGVPNIAVVTGWYDRMEDVLAKLGLGDVDEFGQLVPGTEEFDLYDGNDSLPDPSVPGSPVPPDTYDNFDTLLNDFSLMEQYDIIFINCGNSYEDLLFAGAAAAAGKQVASPAVNNLRDYVFAGGSLYVTDLSYDFVEQPFPEAIDFYGSVATPVNEAEEWGAAEMGESGVVNDADVLDTTLLEWLRSLGALNTDPPDTVYIAGFLSGWAIMNGINADPAFGAKAWIRSNEFSPEVAAASLGGRHGGSRGQGKVAPADVPLTVTFTHGEGRVLYSSYHTEESPSTSLRPQERILAFLVFEVS